jgi:hypothetical protein
MTNMEQAMKKAGVKLPLMHRAWLMVKDHPGATSPRIAQLLKAKEANVSSTMSQLRRRKMVDFKMETVKGRMGIGTGTREIYTYSVPARMKEYELLPLAVPRAKKLAPVTSAPAPSPAPDAPDVARPDPFLQALREGPSPNDLPVQMLDKPPLAFAPPGQPVKPGVPTREEIDRWPLADARQVYDYLRDYFS